MPEHETPKLGRISVRKDTELLQVYANVKASNRNPAQPNITSKSLITKNITIPTNTRPIKTSQYSGILGPPNVGLSVNNRPVLLKDSVTGRNQLVYIMKCHNKNVSIQRRQVPKNIGENSTPNANLDGNRSSSHQLLALSSVAPQAHTSQQTQPVVVENDSRRKSEITSVPSKAPSVTVLNPDHRLLLLQNKSRATTTSSDITTKDAPPNKDIDKASISHPDKRENDSLGAVDNMKNVKVLVKRLSPRNLRKRNVKGRCK